MMDAEGIGAVTMRALGAELNVQAMSLYKHIPNREMLFDAVVDRIVTELYRDPEVELEPSGDWRQYLANMARGIRRYARAHPHAFPLVATRPTDAPWINPPLRSLDWIEAFLSGLSAEGFDDDEVLFAYRTFNGFLLGFLLLETSAMAIQAPRPGDGTFSSGSAPDPVPGGLTPVRTAERRIAISDADTSEDRLDPQGELALAEYPTIRRLAEGLSEDHFNEEFEAGLTALLDQISTLVTEPGRLN